MPGVWATTRKATLPHNWATIRRRILNRDNHACRWVDEDGQTCGAHANEVDHIGDRLEHTDNNLRALCTWHHARRSSAQGNQARQHTSTKRKPEPHPGLIT